MDALTLGPASPRRDAAAPPPEADVLVLGGGVAGLAAARLLAGQGRRVALIEAAPRLGGGHRSTRIGPHSFDAGSLFYEADGPLLRAFPGMAPLCRPVERVQRRIAPDGTLRRYPLDPSEVLGWPRARLARAALDLLVQRARPGRAASLDDACRRRLGDALYRGTGLRAYVRRFHGEDGTAIAAGFFEQRMGFVARATGWGAMLRLLRDALSGERGARRRLDGAPRTPLVVRPREGFDALFAVARSELEAMGVAVALDTRVEAIRRSGAGVEVLTSRGPARAAAVVSTIPLELAHRAAFGRGTGLASLDLLVLFVTAGRLDPGVGTVLFNFHGTGRWKRLTVYSRLYPGAPDGREAFGVEVTLGEGQAPDPGAAFADLAAHLQGLNLATDLRLEGHDLVRGAYPLLRPGQEGLAAEAVTRLAALGVVPLGRQGRFEYLPTAGRVLARVAEELAAAPLPAPRRTP